MVKIYYLLKYVFCLIKKTIVKVKEIEVFLLFGEREKKKRKEVILK